MIRDMTYCSNTNCKEECIRNQNLITNCDEYIWIADFNKCEFFERVEDE